MPSSPSPSSASAKVVLIGATGVGKTSIILRHNGQGFTTHISPTIGASFCRSTICVDKHTVEMQVWDTAGQERFRSMAPMYYRNANAAIAVYDITSEESFHEMQSWVTELRQRVLDPMIICVLGNKCDRHCERDVTLKSGEDYAESIGADFCETSALNGAGIQKAFRGLAVKILDEKGLMGRDGEDIDLTAQAAKHQKKCLPFRVSENTEN